MVCALVCVLVVSLACVAGCSFLRRPPKPPAPPEIPGLAPNPLIGQAAPDFTGRLLGGGEFSLAAQKDKVLVLHFLAIPSSLAGETMKRLASVIDAYKGKGVVACAVYESEDPDLARQFLERRSVGIAVAEDRDHKVADLFHVEGLPQTIVIGKDGVVKSPHSGAWPYSELQLTEELDALVAGQDLTTAALPTAPPQPVPAGKEAYTERQFRQSVLDWNRKTMAQAYQKVGRRSPAWDKQALDLLELTARAFSATPDAPSDDRGRHGR